MPDIDPFENIEFFRELKRIQEQEKEAKRKAWSNKNETLVTAGERLVAQGLDQWQLLERMWATTQAHVSLLKLAGIQRTGRKEDRTASINDTLDISSKPLNLPSGLAATIGLHARNSTRGRRFHQTAEETGLDEAINMFVAPDVCVIRVFERSSNAPLTNNWLDPGDFTSPDKQFMDTWSRSSNPFRRFIEYDCVAERGKIQPNSSLHKHPMTPTQLIYGAGLWAVHNAWLEEMAHYLP